MQERPQQKRTLKGFKEQGRTSQEKARQNGARHGRSAKGKTEKGKAGQRRAFLFSLSLTHGPMDGWPRCAPAPATDVQCSLYTVQ